MLSGFLCWSVWSWHVTVYLSLIRWGHLMVLSHKPISWNCGFALLWMTNRENMAVNKRERKKWWESKKRFESLSVGVKCFLFVNAFSSRKTQQQMSWLPCCAVRDTLKIPSPTAWGRSAPQEAMDLCWLSSFFLTSFLCVCLITYSH